MKPGALLTLLLLVPPPAWAAARTEVLSQGGPAANRLNLVIVGDGYTEAEQDKLGSDARALATSILSDGPTGVPYSVYAGYFNVTLVYAISAESGADHPAQNLMRNTAFDATFDCAGIERLVCVTEQKVLSVVAAAVPEVDIPVVLVNDEEYGGSGGEVATVSTNPLSVQILQHELGHTLAHLADEYDSPFPGFPPCDPGQDCTEPNATLRTQRNEIKWSPWIDASTPLPTSPQSFPDAVGLFEGARYLSRGVFRPQADCAMRGLGQPFCAVCREALVTAFYNRVSPLDSATPSEPVALAWNEKASLTVAHPETAKGTVVVHWAVDGKPLDSATGDVLQVGSVELGAGPHVVMATVEDDTPLVRDDLRDKLRAQATFEVDASAGACGDGQVNGPEGCDDGNTAPGDGCSATCTVEPKPEKPKPHHGCSSAGERPGLAALLLLLSRRRRVRACAHQRKKEPCRRRRHVRGIPPPQSGSDGAGLLGRAPGKA